MKKTLLNASLLIAALGFLAPASQASYIDWDTLTWTPGATTMLYDVNSDTINDVQVTLSGAVLTGNTVISTSPYTGGLFPHKSLQLWTTGAGTMTLQTTFLHGGIYDTGVTDLAFDLFDVDGDGGAGSGRDLISNISATLASDDVTTILPQSLTPGNAAFTQVTGPNSAQGIAIANDNTSEGTLTVDFGTSAIRSFVFTYANTIAPANGIALSDVPPPVIPEAGTVAACAVASLVGIWGLRRMRKVQPEPIEA